MLENEIEYFFDNIKYPKKLKSVFNDICDKNVILNLKLISEL
jgi:hypothetical protein